MNTFGIPTTCKFCKQPVVLRIANECPPELYEGLVSMAACNRCGDRIEKRNKANDGIKDCCTRLSRKIESLKAGERLSKEVISAAMQTLSVLTRHISEVVADAHGSTTIVWSEEFPRMLVENPDRWHPIVKDFRHRAAAWHREQNTGVQI